MDNYIVSARKYRPANFESVVGQEALTTTLKRSIEKGKLAHAYLFCGPRGVGKTSCARIFAKTINCLSPNEKGEACDHCESCVAFNEQRSYNIQELDAASNNKVDDIHSLMEKVRIPPIVGRYKVFIIDEVHMLSLAAFNAFLKTLEEPPAHAIFILATTEKHKVIPTILSRCQIYDFSRISIADTMKHLLHVAEAEDISVEKEGLNIIAQKAEGSMRDALSIFDQVVSFTEGKVTYKAVIENLNVLDYDYYFKLTDLLLAGKVRESLLVLNEILLNGFDGQRVINGLASHFRDLLVAKDKETLSLLEVGENIKMRYQETAKLCNDRFLFQAIEKANQCDFNYRQSQNKRLLLELTLIQICQLTLPTENTSTEKKNEIKKIETEENKKTTPPSPQRKNEPAASTTKTIKETKAIRTTQSTQPNTLPKVKSPLSKIPHHHSLTALRQQQNESKKGTTTSTSTQQEQKKEISSDFTQQQLETVWKTYEKTLTKEIHLKKTILNTTPVLKPEFKIEVPVYNPGQENEINGKSLDLINYIRKQLKNDHITLYTKIIEREKVHKVYTELEKYEHLKKIN
ncbi:MAG: DNA polymerase III subunit gamma/tau, partial [Massilibacteroides sp.]|nr:DNA polymerase III subunit gamma/tau [Massilibacteroides sp.]